MDESLQIRDLRPAEAGALGDLMVREYSRLEGFPSLDEAPAYYAMLADVGRFAACADSRVMVAVDGDRLLGGVVYFLDMAGYGSGGTATQVKQAAGIRLLVVDPAARRRGVGRRLTLACLERARRERCREVILHTTSAMQAAWKLYEGLGFVRSPDLDFLQQSLPVFGFRLPLSESVAA